MGMGRDGIGSDLIGFGSDDTRYVRRFSASLYCFDWLVDISRGATAFGNETSLRGPCFGVFFMLLIFFFPGPPVHRDEAREESLDGEVPGYVLCTYVCMWK